VFEAYRSVDAAAEGLQLLQAWLERHPGLDLLTQVFQATLELQGAQAALALVRAELHRSPSLPALEKYLEARLLLPPDALAPPAAGAGDERADLELIKGLVHRQVNRLSVFICRQCGFKARKFHWHCPACGQWESYPPRRHAELDDLARGPAM
jgi:lipopolysaccharide biosynthesis regulator YciM